MTMLFTPNSNSCWCYHQVKYLYLATPKIEEICKKKAGSLKNILLHCDARELKAVQHTYLQQCYYLTSTLFFISQHRKMRHFMKSQFTFSYRLFFFRVSHSGLWSGISYDLHESAYLNSTKSSSTKTFFFVKSVQIWVNHRKIQIKEWDTLTMNNL